MKIKLCKIGYIASCILAAICLICSFFVTQYHLPSEIVDEMFQSAKGLKYVISTLRIEIAKLKFINNLNFGTLLFLWIAVGCNLYGRIIKIENKSN